jgi:hypothetical protein
LPAACKREKRSCLPAPAPEVIRHLVRTKNQFNTRLHTKEKTSDPLFSTFKNGLFVQNLDLERNESQKEIKKVFKKWFETVTKVP